jgi:molybdopterin-containing oxidoreductase family iron-sulfur binding subunit
MVRETFRKWTLAGADFEENWKKFLHDGYWEGTGYKPARGVGFSEDKLAAILIGESAPQALSRDNLEVIFHRDLKVDDGRYNNNGWLQEMPDPVTKLTWDDVVLMSRKTASELGLKNGEVVRLELEGRTVEGPAWVQPGMADYSLGLALGYGRETSYAHASTDLPPASL